MPIYSFKCNSCSKVFEELCRSNTASYQCSCGADANRIIRKVANVKYVGNGWGSVDAATEKRLVEANGIAANMYERRAEMNTTKLSENDDFWNDIAKDIGE